MIGSYKGPDTPAARVDARIKIILLFGLTVALFSTSSAPVVLLVTAVLLLVFLSARVRISELCTAVLPILVLLVFTLVANAFRIDGSGGVALVGSLGIDPAGAMRGAVSVARIVLLLGFSLVVASSCSSTEICDAVVRLLRPLELIGVPLGALGMISSIALRFIPIVGEELMRIQVAQRSRGAHFDEGPVVARVGLWATVLTPLVISLFRRADRLADAMAARCFDEKAGSVTPRKRLRPLDWAVLAIGMLALILIWLLG